MSGAPAVAFAAPDEEPPLIAQTLPRRRRGAVPWLAMISFAVLVLIPVAMVATYFAGHAADQYVASARFTIQEVETAALPAVSPDAAPDETGSGQVGGLFATERISPLTHVAASYLESAALLAALRDEHDIEAMLDREPGDLWARLPPGAAAEELHAHWQDIVRVAVDGPSGIVSVQVRAFRPEDALTLAEAMLARTEALVNDLSLRQKREALARARAEAAESEARLAEAIARLTETRGREGMLDPLQEAGETVRLMAELTTERIRLASQIRVLNELSNGDAPRARALQTRLAKVTEDIASLRQSLAADAGADATLADALGRFEELEIRRRFAAQLYGLAQTRAIEAEIDLARQTVFLNLFDPPRLPEMSVYPRRVAFTLLIAAVLATAWAILALIWASVADHRLDARL